MKVSFGVQIKPEPRLVMGGPPGEDQDIKEPGCK